ncbi:putative tubulin-tyrosine ligase [Leishmania braziliensis MHOM/BR/75/M2904]|uniref:Tubulin--tyrosine ligase-like protein 5 n=2 Tax=Leishmania braziliensis TaxID=5660 RepID=E9AID0_LEIBR|nr:putative tubulin-tyrosine ligase [Leishmania braziliensis MHOM/BR/75/M2904]CAJ2471967.1 unnamed protein product [Leishmania braziliensis]CBZ14574.1 putative tubulin-tyrosine ligase [Leishmania braziliensis MHOM/BR/75/M2904]SYZ65518.1 tubulin-tyrosine_ligase [Leishmania braziliensis MHOM/BR/75/M2904]
MSAGEADQHVVWNTGAPLSSLTHRCGDGDVVAAARRARSALEPFLVSPSVVLDPSSTTTSTDESAGLTSTDVYLVDSPYNRRRPTIAFVPYDKPATGDERHHSNRGTEDESISMHIDVLVQPDRLPLGPADGRSGESGPAASALDVTQSQRRVIPRASAGPYSRLSYIMDENCTPFTALLATLRVAGFTRVSGRAALLHKTHSLLWVKRLLPSMVNQALQPQTGAYRKVNHFPATHALGRKDKLCLLLRRAGLRWQASGNLSTALSDTCARSAAATRAAVWASLTPESWLLPQEVEACVRAIRQPHPSAAASPLFIVKPTNLAGGQGIFLIRGSSEAGVMSLMAAVGGLGGGPSSTSRKEPVTGSLDSSAVGSTAVAAAPAAETVRSNYIVQRYMANPFLLEGRKFDLRLYVVVTSYDPVRMYLYREGLVRIASLPYIRTTATAAAAVTTLADVSDLRAHLTNFTLNKGASLVMAGESDADAATAGAAANGSDTKWSLRSLEVYVASMGYDWPGTLQRIHELLRLVFLSVTPEVREALRASSATRLKSAASNTAASLPPLAAVSSHATTNGTSPFFEIFGVDVLLLTDDSEENFPHDLLAVSASACTLRPVLLEVNIMPSLSTHYSLFDQRIKANFIADALTLVGLMPPPPLPKVAFSTAGVQNTTGSQRSCYNDAFLDGLCDSDVLNVCLATEEEHRRADNFTRLLPTRNSASKYKALMEVAEENGTPTAAPSRLDAVLSSWLASSP